MIFFETYKRLDNLCKDLLRSDKGVTTYIFEMEQCASSAYQINGWKDDYEKLKYYRHIRNKIAHEPGCVETDFCSVRDVEWLEQFYQRILNREDPLALYENMRMTYKMTYDTKEMLEDSYQRSPENGPKGLIAFLKRILWS